MSTALTNAHTRTAKYVHDLFADREKGAISLEFLFVVIGILAVAALAVGAFTNKGNELVSELMGS